MSLERVGIVFKYVKQEDDSLLIAVAGMLAEKGVSVFLDEESCGPYNVDVLGAKLVSREEMAKESEIIISIGGDGTFLGTVRDTISFGRPVIGFNLGTLGFLTPVLPRDMYRAICMLMEGKYDVEERDVLSSKLISCIGERLDEGLAVNDIVVRSSEMNKICSLVVEIDGEIITTVKSDGLIIATTTGSTAYSLSAGGPLLHPSISGIVLTPICAHSLTQKPLVIPSKSKVKVYSEDGSGLVVSPDGLDSIPLSENGGVYIEKNNTSSRVISLKGYSYFGNLKEKLGWG